MSLPQGLTLPQTQNTWATQLDPVIACPLVKGHLLQNVSLINGTTIVNHKLGRKLIGWFPVRQGAIANLYDTQDSNQTPQLTLSLISDADVTVSLWVF